ncbi:autotransporter outer membrane beta-barrel domain-containing protein [Sphingobium sp. YBL2]|uniref:autotransporter outer membrane beta-barrel domain-containing protein n=1 Tax=Sphingobium sp. (strain YBL2) TaxID=484429 RepID=UPI0005CC7EF6|nr:autotransporter outer membrane beta-barrel domain-containing protein [Sphingobium sp. YBL2]AJR22748.1 hypothetical protein TZ53_02100 [Sphingobium sp. YBL2]
MNLKNCASKWALLASASVITALGTGSSAQAACTTANGIVTCTGDNQPFTITSDTQTIIAQDATVTGSGLSAIRLNSTRANLVVNGTVSATGAAVLTIQNGDRILNYDPYAGAASPRGYYSYPYLYPTGQARILIGEQGVISGDTGIWIERSSNNYLGGSTASIDNSGLITATSGSAIRGPSGLSGVSYTSITNQESGTIHGIAAPIETITNAGLIDGRGNAAIDVGLRYDSFFASYGLSYIINSGTITSTAGATIIGQHNPLSVNNSGLIGNSNGGQSIHAGSNLYLTNSGTIQGDIVASGASTIDSTAGTIEGDVLLGDGDDIIIAALDENNRLTTGITGQIDGGAGTNAIALTIAADATLTGAPLLPTRFSLLQAGLSNQAKLTLDTNFSGTSRLYVFGTGTLLNQGLIDTQGRAMEAYGSGYSSPLSLQNNGTIKASLRSATDAAVSIDGVSLTNDGSIEATGGAGVLLKSGYGTALTNNGTVSATGSVAILFGGGYSSSATLVNKAGGIIRGDTAAIAILPDSSPYSYASTTITNAGSIIGHVDLTGAASTDRFVMQQGGTVSGDIRLGAGDDSYIFDGTMRDDGFLAGISGVLDGGAGTDQLLARIKDDAAITLGNTINFETVGLDIAEGKQLSLAGTTGGAQLSLYGKGSVDLSLDIAGQNVTLINASGYGFNFPGDSSSFYVQTGTTIVSRGSLNAAFDSAFYGGSTVQLDQLDRFTNEGSISLTQPTNPYGARASAISGGKEVVNKGEILLNGGSAIAGALTVTNSGMIVEVSGGAAAVGVSSFRDLTNSGTIRTSGSAVYASDYSASTVRNSGTIESTGTRAIIGGYAPTVVVNHAGGTITGGAGLEAIALSGGGAVSNAGTINGDVNLSYSPYGGASYASGAYVDRGGTLNGDLLFGAGNDIFVASSDTLSVRGSIDAGDGVDSFVRAYDASRTVDLNASPSFPGGFERFGVGALGENTVITFTATNSSIRKHLTLVGDGAIVNQADFSTANPSEQLLTLGSSIDPLNLSGAGSTLNFINQGKISGAVGGYTASFTNEGTISNSASGVTAVELIANSPDGFTFQNSGTIVSPNGSPYFYTTTGVTIQGASDSQIIDNVAIGNSGSITGGLSASFHATEFSFANYGTIEPGLNSYLPSVSLSLGQSYYSGTDTNADKATISNGGSLTNAIDAAIAAKALAFSNSGTIGSSLYGAAVLLTQTAHETRDMTQGLYGAIDQESLSFANSGTLNGSAYLYSSATAIAVTNSGTIDAPISSLVQLDDPALRIEGSSQANQTVAFSNSGQISTSRLGASAVSIESDARSAEQQMNGFDAAEGPIAGEPTTTINVTNSGTLSADGGASYRPATTPPYPWYPSFPESLTLAAALSIDASSGGQSSITVTNEAGGIISAVGATRNAANAQNPVVAGLENVGSTAFVGSANQITLVNAGTIRGLQGGIVPASLQVDPTASDHDFAGQFLAGAIQTINSADNVTNLATGVITGSVDLGVLDDRMANYGTINGNVYLGEGNDRFTHGLGATLNGTVDGGTGTDALVIDITGGGLLNQPTLDKFVNFEEQSITGTGTITTDGPLSIASLVLRDANLTLAAGQTLKTASDTSIVFASGTNSLANLGTIAGSLNFAAGTNSFVNLGSIAGPVTLGGGSNSFTVGAGSSVSGPVIANGTDDLLILAGGGTDAAPQESRLSGFTGFERTRQDSGTLALSGDFTTGQLTLVGGRFISRTGSVLNAPSILVNQGATFGSAGTVNGNIMVQGTLSPGASPGTMTVNGNVALAGSSTTLFEMTPTISDALIINGTLSIAPGATLKITGNRPLTPGVTYELITATSGITGSFATIDKASSVVGFVRQGDHSIDLLGQFVLGSGASGQVTQTVNYLNDLLIAGTATSGILNAAPSLLLADGTVNQAAAARLNAESYASASQIGIENGLAIASALRTASTSARGEETGLFTFGQTLGGWRRLPGDAALGTARANISTYGALAGIGLGSQTASLGAFVGYIDVRQQIGALQARTKAEGIMAGAVAQASLGRFHVAASFSYDGSKADTDRSLLSSSKLSSHYRLRSWTADISLGHAFALNDGWSFEPEVGFTHVSSRRGSASETGDAVWALDVQRRRTKASFLRGALELHGPAEARINPWLSAGVLHQLSGNSSFATAAYAGVSDDLTVAGVSRSRTLATVGAGVNLRVSSAATLFFSGNSEFGAESSGQNLTAGLRIRF